ncbi:uncharacterized protein LOC111784221 isoform X1 [Cucurbita pepo subsp. pepo]|uniref:uncharacterized protein LOC111784221 isoform X1 n=1 Tax=Cucurbita pepo subsp. pepo TaxID=3664 RepID=UPI000C9D4344|nr:uncharacterized protein LOC111784221 isoform X1 [Cucurbita pepo subsp. pepo]
MNSRLLQTLYRTAQNRAFTSRVGSSANYSCGITNGGSVSQLGIQKTSFLSNTHTAFSLARGHKMIICSAVAADLSIFSHSIGIRLATTQAKAPPQARQMGALKVSMLSPGIIYEPYSPRQPIPFWQRWFTRSGWRRTKDDIILELKSAYAIAKLRKKGYSKKQFYEEAVNLYKEINTLIANGDKTLLRKAVTENMYSALKNEIKLRESKWNKVYWEMILPVVKIRTLRARLIGVDRSDLEKVFVQLTLEILAKQKFEAYNAEGAVVAGDKSKEVLVRDIWVFEKSLFHEGAFWRLCGRIPI